MNQIKEVEIKQIEVEIKFYKEQAVQSIFEIGERLIKAKELVPHGKWGNWLKKEVDFSLAQAQRFMQVAREFPNAVSLRGLNQSKVFALVAMPKEERENFIEENPVEDMTTKELRQAIKEKNQLKKELEEAKSKHNDLLNKNIKLEEREPEVIEKEVEVIPEDYKYYKESTKKYYRLQDEVRDLKEELNNREDNKEDFNKLRKQYEEKVNESYELKQQIKQMTHIDSGVKHQEKLKDTAVVFATRVHTFLNDVGGLAWLTEYIDELDDYDKRSYLKAIDLLEGWVLTVKANINKGE